VNTIADRDADIVIDLNLSIDWQRSAFSDVPWAACLTSGSRPFYIKRMRDLCGHEALQLQGIDMSRMFTGSLSHTALIDLAGEAYNLFALAAVFIAGISCVDVATLVDATQAAPSELDVSTITMSLCVAPPPVAAEHVELDMMSDGGDDTSDISMMSGESFSSP
jgi:hypothetical protein